MTFRLWRCFVTDPKFRQCANSFYQLFPRFGPLWREHKPSRSESLTGDDWELMVRIQDEYEVEDNDKC